MLQALRIRDFRLLWIGGLVSALGSWLLILAIPAHVFLATGSLRDTGLTLAAQYLPVLLLGLVAGVFTDRWDRRRLMIATSMFRAAAVALMLLGTSPGRYWVLYAALIAESGGGVLYVPAVRARTPAIVGTGTLLSSANSLNAVTGGAMQLIGGPLGGILLATYGIKWLICADALSYLLSAATMFMTSRPDRERTGRKAAIAGRKAAIAGVARDLIAGVHVLHSQPVARALLPVTVIFLAANASLSSVLIALGVHRLGGSEHTGFLLSCLGAGVLAGAPVLRALLDRIQPWRRHRRQPGHAQRGGADLAHRAADGPDSESLPGFPGATTTPPGIIDWVTSTDLDRLARTAYEAHRSAHPGALPPWEDATEQEQNAWRAAMSAVTSTGDATLADTGPTPSIVIQTGDETRVFHTEFTAGRQGTLIVNDEHASSHHALFQTAHGLWYVEDLGSTNGTWLNGRRIVAAQRLKKRDKVRIGRTVIVVVSA